MDSGSKYMIRRKIFTFLGAAFHIYDASGQLIGYSRQKAFRLREDIRVYRDELRQDEILLIKARNILDGWGIYDVIDSASGVLLGTWKRQLWKSMLRDQYSLQDAAGTPIGVLAEDNMTLALLRRFIFGALLPQGYRVMLGDRAVAEIQQRFNPFVMKVDVATNAACNLDSRLILAAGILLVALEGRQG
jgi:uncharacterized protein YxjI